MHQNGPSHVPLLADGLAELRHPLFGGRLSPAGAGVKMAFLTVVAAVAAAVLELPAAVGRTIGFRDGSVPIAAALATVA